MRTRRALLAPGLGLALALILVPIPTSAAPDRQVLLIVVPELSYGAVLADPVLSELSRAGGLGLMTTSGRAVEPSRTAVNLGAGRSAADAPRGPVPSLAEGDGARVDVDPYVDEAGNAIPGLLGSSLSEAGLGVAAADVPDGSVAMLAAMDREGLIPSVGSVEVARDADVVVGSDTALLPELLDTSEAGEVLVIVVGAGAAAQMRERGDTAAPIVLSRGPPAELLAGGDAPSGLTSSTTRRDGVVSDVDVAPTILSFLDAPAPEEMVGTAIRLGGDPPTDLHDRSLDHHDLVGPIGAAILGLALISLFAGLALVFLFGSRPGWIAHALASAMLVSLALWVSTTPASMLPSFAPPVVLGCLLIVGGAVLALATVRGGADPRAAVATVAVTGLVFVAVDGVLGWPSQLTPLLGGGVLDGERFFGLGNAHAGIVLAGAVLGAARLAPRVGLALIVGAAVFAGLPFLGADLGGCITLTISAALWFGVARWRLGWRTWVLAVGAAIVAGVLVLLADRVLPGGSTHVSSVAEGGPLGSLLDRLGANVRTTSANASAWLAVLGLPVWLVLALRRSERLRPALGSDDRWRDAVIVLAIAGIAGYLLNDTYGLAGSTFAFVSAAVLYPTLRA